MESAGVEKKIRCRRISSESVQFEPAALFVQSKIREVWKRGKVKITLSVFATRWLHQGRKVFMKYILVICFLLAGSVSALRAQLETPPSKEIPKLPLEMTYQEYQQLVRELNWKRIGIATMVPGYIHLYADRRKTAYAIAGIRGAGMLFSAGALFRQWYETKTFRFVRGGHWETNFTVFLVGMMMNAAGFAFDWAHGDWIIEKERTLVQYKYGMKRGMLSSKGTVEKSAVLFTVTRKF